LLDKFSMTKPDLSASLVAQLSAPPSATLNGASVYSVNLENNSPYSLNGTQVRITLPASLSYVSGTGAATVQGSDVVVTLGRLAAGAQQVIQLKTRVAPTATAGTLIQTVVAVTSGTALPVTTNTVSTKVVAAPALPLP
jgi:uncharacterized repeat protein (TIGR01451 family)